MLGLWYDRGHRMVLLSQQPGKKKRKEKQGSKVDPSEAEPHLQ